MENLNLLDFLNKSDDTDAATLQHILTTDQAFNHFTLLRLMQLAKSCNNQTATRAIELLLQLRTSDTNTTHWSEPDYVNFFKDELKRRGYRIELPPHDGAEPPD